jgi:hypothetical protein
MALLRRQACVALFASLIGAAAFAQADPEFTITIKNHRFERPR